MSTLSVRKYQAFAAIYEDNTYEYNEFFTFPKENFLFHNALLRFWNAFLLFECNYYFPFIFSVDC